MGCSGCGDGSGSTPKGCGDKGHCATGGCNKHNTYDWIAARDIYDPSAYNIVEVSFKNGSHKDFYINDPMTYAVTGDMVVVEVANGYDVGQISLSGDLARLQMKKKYIAEDNIINKILRKANERDIQKLDEARALERETMIKARVIARTLGLEMKIGDVAFQGDKKKATFYYTAEGRVDFRELVKEYAREFKVKIEMRQIGARQEAARIGGIGSCGRELCCSTWLSDFKSVSTSAARYQNIAINQSKLTGQCGRLKCCLNYELDMYLDALEDFPEDADVLKTQLGTLVLMKTDIFKRLLYYSYEHNDKVRGNKIIVVSTARAKELKMLNNKGIIPNELLSEENLTPTTAREDDENVDHGYEDVTGLIELRPEPRHKKKKKSHPNSPEAKKQGQQMQQGKSENKTDQSQGQLKRPQHQGKQNGPKNPGQTNQAQGKQQPKREPNPNQGTHQGNQVAKPEHNKPNPHVNQQSQKKHNPNQDVNQGNQQSGSEQTKPNPNPNANTGNKKKKFFNKNRKPKQGDN